MSEDDATPAFENRHHINNFNLPHVIAGPAGNAISRLIGAAASLPAAKMEQIAQGIRDTTEAKSTVSNAASNAAVQDQDLVHRAMQSLISKEYRRQLNKEAIAKATIDDLRTNQPSEAPQKEITDDWLNIFERYAEDANSDRLRATWAQVLSGEIRKPGSFSLSTLRFISELDQPIAMLFEKYAAMIINYEFMSNTERLRRERLGDLLQMQEAGLIAGVGSGNVTKNITLHNNGYLLVYRTNGLLLTGPPGAVVPIPAYPLTRAGRELSHTLSPIFDIEIAKEFVSHIPKTNLTEIKLGTVTEIAGGYRFKNVEQFWHRSAGNI